MNEFTDTVATRANRWLESRSSADLALLRNAVVRADGDEAAYDRALEFLGAGDFQQARDRMVAGMPRWFLSPAAHNLLALANAGLGHDDNAAGERQLSGLALRTILESGDATEVAPLVVLRVADIYDVLMFLDKTPVQQSLGVDGLDHIECSDGSELWFEQYEPTSERAAS